MRLIQTAIFSVRTTTKAAFDQTRLLSLPTPVARPYLVLLLLINYLLVVGAGMAERPARVIDRPFAYVHSKDCQLRHTLRLACLDDCNGTQYTLKKHGERPPFHQLITSFKGLDLHCLPETRLVVAAPVFSRLVPRYVAREAEVPTGFRGQIDSPPRRG